MSEQYSIREVKTRQEMDEVMDVIWAANYMPYEPFMQIFFPVLGFTPAHREAAIADSKARFWKYHEADSTSHWFYVHDTVTNKAVSCAQWVISESNVFATGTPKLTTPWWPEGEHREFCESMLNQVYKPRAKWMRRPFVALNWMAVHPHHRQRGLARRLMDVGVVRADQLNLESWMEASPMGRPVYEKFGFRSLLKLAFDTERPNPSDEWRRCEQEMTPGPFHVMWRPKQGAWGSEAGEVKLPWDLGEA